MAVTNAGERGSMLLLPVLMNHVSRSLSTLDERGLVA